MQLISLHQQIFGGQIDRHALREHFERQQAGTLWLAHRADRLLGYKIGYARKKAHYYSWLGGIDPAARKQGLGSRLMQAQHNWCQQQGYRTIRTHTKNKWREMLILNLRHGFDIIGTLTDELGEPKLILEKKLPPKD